MAGVAVENSRTFRAVTGRRPADTALDAMGEISQALDHRHPGAPGARAEGPRGRPERVSTGASARADADAAKGRSAR